MESLQPSSSAPSDVALPQAQQQLDGDDKETGGNELTALTALRSSLDDEEKEPSPTTPKAASNTSMTPRSVQKATALKSAVNGQWFGVVDILVDRICALEGSVAKQVR